MKRTKYEINVNKAVKEAIEKIVARGKVEKEWEQLLISTAAEYCELLFNKRVDEDGKWAKQAEALQSEMGFFLPSLTEAMFTWIREDRTEVIEGLRSLAAYRFGE